MTQIISLIIIATLFSMMLFLVIRNLRYKAFAETKNRIAPSLLAADVLLLALEPMAHGAVFMRMVLDMMPVLVSFLFLDSSVWKPLLVRCVCSVSFFLLLSMICLHLLAWSGAVPPVPDLVYMRILPFSVLLLAVLLVWGIWLRVRDIRTVIKGGTVQTNLDLCVDLVYAVLITAVPAPSLCPLACGKEAGVLQCASALFSVSLIVALGIRAACNSFFAVLHDHERKIVESMKISQVEMANGVREDTYRQLYDRIVEYFEQEKPFLDNRLTINDVVRVVFSNKVYISRAISQFTGRNFCQFVNYYRISYSKECFRTNPDLKVSNLAELSGFNSVVSYNMAFRLFMNENPSDWCRKERQKMRKKKK